MTLEEWLEVLPLQKMSEGVLIASIEDVLEHTGNWNRNYGGHWVKMFSHRYFNFREHGTACVRCGAKGLVFVLEKDRKFPEQKGHFNLYGQRPSGMYVLMTKDHIVPKSKGGPDRLSNYQTMCAICNVKKGGNFEPGYVPVDQPALPVLDSFPIFEEGEDYKRKQSRFEEG